MALYVRIKPKVANFTKTAAISLSTDLALLVKSVSLSLIEYLLMNVQRKQMGKGWVISDSTSQKVPILMRPHTNFVRRSNTKLT